MFFFTLLLLSSSFLSVLAAPIPKRRPARELARRDGSGWPGSNPDPKAFGIDGGFQESWITDFKDSDGKSRKVLQATYPKGSYAGAPKPHPGMGGFTFQATGGPDVNIKNATAATFSYSVFFPEGFGFQEGGKLPGPYGESNGAEKDSGSGGRKDDKKWSARLMWRKGGKGELYAYLPSVNKDHPVCKNGACGLKYGISIGTGNFVFVPGRWNTIKVYIRLNSSPNTKDGVIEVFHDGKSVIKVEGLILRIDETGHIAGIMVHTFFGGSTSPIWKAPANLIAFFEGFGIAVE